MHKNIIDVIKYRWAFITLSLLLIIPSIAVMIYSMIKYENHVPLRLGIDFTGGTMLQYEFKEKPDVAIIREQLKTVGIENATIQVEENNVVSIRTKFLESESSDSEAAKVNSALREKFGEFVPLQVSAIGPTLGNELFQNAVIALLLAFAGIVGYLTVRFSLDYAMFALVALFHDAIFVLGAFSLFGLLYGTEIDSLFITAILTVIGFSVHDTIVVFDRVRENTRFYAKNHSFNEIVNMSVNQTLARSINTSLTTLLTLGALYFFGGVTTRDFVLAMILGIITGTYSSIFNASVLLAWWREKTKTRLA
ncbi:MAG: protein-export membrane protein SecF [Candidatus Melainabacteria bacterium GWF2_37_15]|nr:MAG: protein-export membrane protein SecF [Candidatus Melainabacteria bacterium GWF2_37_15]